MSKSKDHATAASRPAVETNDSSAEVFTKEQRGAYLGPKGPPVEMTQNNFINPNPTVSPASQPTTPPASDPGSGSDS